jgi:predicted amidohydrolase
MNEVRISLCQFKVVENKKNNIKKAKDFIKKAAEDFADIVVLPEMFNCPYDNSKFNLYAEEENNSDTLNHIKDLAIKHDIYIVAGSIPEKCEDKIYNTSFALDNKGKLIARHRKIHLFDINIPGKIKFCESEILSAGSDITVFDTKFCKIGIVICYDMRFPELIRLTALKGADIILSPAAFNNVTGPVHWENTIKMRAIDNQVFFGACSPAKNENSSYKAYGHSMISDPWGKIINSIDESEGIVNCSLNLNLIEKYREELPLIKHMREDVYKTSIIM